MAVTMTSSLAAAAEEVAAAAAGARAAELLRPGAAGEAALVAAYLGADRPSPSEGVQDLAGADAVLEEESEASECSPEGVEGYVV